MPEITLLVETADLRHALTAVAPFTQPKIDTLARVSVRAGEHFTTVSATNGHAAALAVVSTLHLGIDVLSDDTVAVFDLSSDDARKILQVFKGKAGKDDEPGEELRIEVDSESVTLTDASGMFEGQQLVLPRTPMIEHAPNVHNYLGQYIHRRPRSPEGAEVPLFGPNVALFVGACKVYDTQMTLELHGSSDRLAKGVTLVRIGSSFIGALTITPWDEETAETEGRRRKTWTHRISPALTAVP